MSDFFVMRIHEFADGQRVEYDVVVPVRQNCPRHPGHIEVMQVSGAKSGRSLCASPSTSYYAEMKKRVRFAARKGEA